MRSKPVIGGFVQACRRSGKEWDSACVAREIPSIACDLCVKPEVGAVSLPISRLSAFASSLRILVLNNVNVEGTFASANSPHGLEFFGCINSTVPFAEGNFALFKKLRVVYVRKLTPQHLDYFLAKLDPSENTLLFGDFKFFLDVEPRARELTIAAARVDNFYYPPEWTPDLAGLNKFHGQHALCDRAKKVDQDILIIRYNFAVCHLDVELLLSLTSGM
ncbi:hypothetical protein R1flu_014503 [Riccia fluitans]|uniref:Uncharacterized protein n=1 Tax=Riccia fluitans TaxID=41844 RepID=A0ABD1YJE4_9MARC